MAMRISGMVWVIVGALIIVLLIMLVVLGIIGTLHYINNFPKQNITLTIPKI